MKNHRIQKTLFSIAAFIVAASVSLTAQGGQSSSPFIKSAQDAQVERQVNKILGAMTLEEKLGQMSLRDWSEYKDKDISRVKEDIRRGKVGGFLNVPRSSYNPNAFATLQKIAVEESRLGVPLIFGHDVIHGYKTIFPIPLGQAATWNPSIVELGARVAAKEATSAGIRWTFAPMIDIGRDPRWGRIAETLGEDVFLTSTLTAAMVRGFQGDDLSRPDSLAACAKHFAGYGSAEGGRDYNTANVSMRQLHDHHLPPFKAAIDAGAVSLMTSYSELDGIPATADKHLLTDILREQWGFTGFVVSDWNSVMEMVAHGFSPDARDAAKQATKAGLDFEMYSTALGDNLPELIASSEVDEAQVDTAVRRMLRAKIAMGLFQQPYSQGDAEFLKQEYLDAAKDAAMQSFVLLKNENKTLPLGQQQKVAVIGPLAEAPYQQMGTWVYEGEAKHSRTLLPALDDYLGEFASNVKYAAGLSYSRSVSKEGFAQAIKVAKASDVIVFFGGEEAVLTGEGHSRGNIDLPGAQVELISELAKLNKPLVLVVLAGRPNGLEHVVNKVDSLMMAWHPGTMAGPALVDVLYGEQTPSGKLPITWPKASGQVPIYYNHKATGRPPTDSNYTRMDKIRPDLTWQHEPGNSSNYLDYGHRPQFPFGYGLSYSSFKYSNLKLANRDIALGDDINVSIDLQNTGSVKATEIVQLYIKDIFGDVTRPVKELKSFERVTLKSGQTKTISFTLSSNDLHFHNRDLEKVVEPGRFKLWIARHANDESNGVDFDLIAR